MGIPTTGEDDAARRSAAGSFTSAVAATTTFRSDHNVGIFNASVWGTFVATVTIERSFDAGATWINLSRDTSGTNNSFTAPFSLTIPEPEPGVIYRFNCTAWTSGTVNWRFSL